MIQMLKETKKIIPGEQKRRKMCRALYGDGTDKTKQYNNINRIRPRAKEIERKTEEQQKLLRGSRSSSVVRVASRKVACDSAAMNKVFGKMGT